MEWSRWVAIAGLGLIYLVIAVAVVGLLWRRGPRPQADAALPPPTPPAPEPPPAVQLTLSAPEKVAAGGEFPLTVTVAPPDSQAGGVYGVTVDAADCDVFPTWQLTHGAPPPALTFHLTPRRTGAISVHAVAYQGLPGKESLGRQELVVEVEGWDERPSMPRAPESMIGRPKIVEEVMHPQPASSGIAILSRWHLDAAVPEEVQVGRAFDLAVTVRPPGAPLLQVDELTRVRSAAAQIEWPAEAEAVTLRAVVHAPDCDVLGQHFQMFRLHRDQPSPIVFFGLRPRRAGELLIRVSLYQIFLALGSARLTAVAVEREAGGVVTRVSSGLPLLGDDGQTPEAFQLSGIYSFLQRAFSMDELHSLSDDLGIDWDDLPGTTKQRKASELVSYCQRRDLLDMLIEGVMAARPDWLELLEER